MYGVWHGVVTSMLPILAVLWATRLSTVTDSASVCMSVSQWCDYFLCVVYMYVLLQIMSILGDPLDPIPDLHWPSAHLCQPIQANAVLH